MKDITDQMAKCVIMSPADGVVVYANQYSSRGGSAEFVVEAGAAVRERQTILKLPDPSRMQVRARINESRITLVGEGMAAKVSITAANDEMVGRVKRVNKYAEPGSWFSSSVKEYATFIEIVDPPQSIRTGMTAEVRIFVQQLPDALQVPVQAIYEYRGHYFCLKKNGAGWDTAEVKIGGTNEKMVTINEGLTEKDEVVLDPRNYMDLMKLPDIPEVADREKLKELAKDAKAPDPAVKQAVAGGPGPGGAGKGKAAAGGGAPTAEAIVDMTFSTVDTNNDGKLQSEEIDAMEESRRERTRANDTNSDGVVDRQEMLQAVKKRMASGGAGKGGRGPGGGGPGGPGGGGGGPGGFRGQ